jgi:hypothetical protein
MEARGRFGPTFDREEWVIAPDGQPRFTLSGDRFVCGQSNGSVIAEYEGWDHMEARGDDQRFITGTCLDPFLRTVAVPPHRGGGRRATLGV